MKALNMSFRKEATNAVKNPTRGVSQELKGGNHNNLLTYWQVLDIRKAIAKEKKERKAKAIELAKQRQEAKAAQAAKDDAEFDAMMNYTETVHRNNRLAVTGTE